MSVFLYETNLKLHSTRNRYYKYKVTSSGKFSAIAFLAQQAAKNYTSVDFKTMHLQDRWFLFLILIFSAEFNGINWHCVQLIAKLLN